MLINLALFVVGIALLWLSSEVVTRKITPIAQYFGVNELVVTVLGVSVLSSLPELTISGFAIAAGHSDISVGNVIGSNFVTLTFVTAVCAFIRPIDIHEQIRERESSWMILSASLVMILSMDGLLSRSDGLILILAYVPYIVTVVRKAMLEKDEHREKPEGKIWLHALLAVLAVLGIIVSAKLALDNGERLGLALGIPAVALGVILFAFGTSLPELAISLAATFRKKADVTISEVYASNIFTQLVVLGICALIRPIAISAGILGFAMPFLILAAVVIQIFITSGRILSRREAVILMLMYGIFAVSNFVPLPSLTKIIGW
ncbi:MAG: sodium:calcium antiporter [Spirochaetes bacterium]|nr:sodium:calcium antiporter [Spirochaetota bacterium]